MGRSNTGRHIPLVLILLPIVTFVVGLLIGGASVALTVSRRTAAREVARATPPQPVAQAAPQVPKAEPVPRKESGPEPKWTPEIGKAYDVTIPDSQAIGNDQQAKYLIARDVTALTDLKIYLQARDGTGLKDMIKAGRLYWSASSRIRAHAIEVHMGIARVRLRENARLLDFEGDERSAVGKEAVVLVGQFDH